MKTLKILIMTSFLLSKITAEAQQPEFMELILSAIKALTGHNTQPWKFRLHESAIEVLPNFANASLLSPKELNNCGILQKGNFDEMVNELIYLKNKYHFKIIGGCCGTDNVFIEKLARRLSMS